ncbi:DUF1128 domain-containing protein [Staphylococcus borealis]|uniref:DUF1128 domain-containing protein n=1 Tax=Staphylococcus borealis TaxID=2742203 RepID=UPI000D1FAE0C|nr:DUF1128 domain-containing protein [Staphylococcus borealis]RIO93088.1 DUF1128 domain-containing protein [Staphylococcus haemolyticus]MCQ9279241.1 DUF1128 domain-containing protein [Staphylococcus borealis]MDM7863762.1 DUF1128 domain-containing protein [Staphylococcus borealis]MDM7882805.1 DUF1128 domain-containing protein [Staphylococcus borealis]MDY4022021.1 DUF1128 domain-containing protein [Staphylococcus borealis]
MTQNNNKEMIAEIRKKLNIVNQGLLNPDKFEEANHQDVEEIYNFVMSKDSFSPSEVTAIADELGNLRQD